MRWALEQDAAHPNSFASIRLAGALSRFWKIRGYQIEAGEWLHRALELAGERGPAQVRGRAYSGLGTIEWDRGDYARSYETHTHAYELYQQAGDDWGQAYALINRIVQNIELGRRDRIERDAFVDNVMRTIGLPIWHVPCAGRYNVADVRAGIASRAGVAPARR